MSRCSAPGRAIAALGIHQNGGELIDWGGDGTRSSALMTRDVRPRDHHRDRSSPTAAAGIGVELVDTT